MSRIATVINTFALSAAIPAGAATITTLFNTGVDAMGTATTGNGADPHWTLAAGTAYNGGNNDQFPIGPWMAETKTSRWLTPTSDAANLYDFSAKTYTFTEIFSLDAYDPATAAFSGRFAADNGVDQITLNGVELAATGGNFEGWTSFDSTGGSFVAGQNTLTFVLANFGTNTFDQNPAGLRVELGGIADAVPEAPVWTLMITGFGMIGFAMRRRTSGQFKPLAGSQTARSRPRTPSLAAPPACGAAVLSA